MTTKLDLIQLAFEELGQPFYRFTGTGTPKKGDIVRMSSRALGLEGFSFAGGFSPKKDYLVRQAYVLCGIGHGDDDTPDAGGLTSTLRLLNIMMLDWRDRGIDLTYDYPLSGEGDGNLSDVSGIPQGAEETVIQSLAVMLAPAIGKTLADGIAQSAAAGQARLQATSVRALQQLNAMMAEWRDAQRIDLAYNFPTSDDGALTDNSGIPMGALQVVSNGLALKIAAALGLKVPDQLPELYNQEFASLAATFTAYMTRLDAMMYEWIAAYQIDLTYDFTVSPTTALTIPYASIPAITTTLALRLAPSVGRQGTPELKRTQAETFSNLRSAYSYVPGMQLRALTIAGQGNRRRNYLNPVLQSPFVQEGGTVSEDNAFVILGS